MLVFLVLLQLVAAGRTVIAAARSSDKATQVFKASGLKEGYQKPGNKEGILVVESGVDVTNADTLTEGLFQGVTQVRLLNAMKTAACVVASALKLLPEASAWVLFYSSELTDVRYENFLASSLSTRLRAYPFDLGTRVTPVMLATQNQPDGSNIDLAQWRRLQGQRKAWHSSMQGTSRCYDHICHSEHAMT